MKSLEGIVSWSVKIDHEIFVLLNVFFLILTWLQFFSLFLFYLTFER